MHRPVENGAVLCVDIDYASIAKSNCAGNAPVMSEMLSAKRVHSGPKPEYLREKHVVEWYCKLRVRRGHEAANESCATLKRNIVETDVFALRLRIEPVGADCVTGCTETRRFVPRNVLLTLTTTLQPWRCRAWPWSRDGAWRGCSSFLRHYNTRPEKQHTCWGQKSFHWRLEIGF